MIELSADPKVCIFAGEADNPGALMKTFPSAFLAFLTIALVAFFSWRGLSMRRSARRETPTYDLPMRVVIVRNVADGCEPLCPQWISAEGQITAQSPAVFKKALANSEGSAPASHRHFARRRCRCRAQDRRDDPHASSRCGCGMDLFRRLRAPSAGLQAAQGAEKCLIAGLSWRAKGFCVSDLRLYPRRRREAVQRRGPRLSRRTVYQSDRDARKGRVSGALPHCRAARSRS